MSAVSYLTQLVQQAISKLNLIETNSKKIEELPFQTTLDPNSKIAVSRSGETEHVNIHQIISAINNDNYNHLISVGTISVNEITNEITIGATVEAMINNITVSKLTDTILSVPFTSTGLIRKDYFYINSLGEVLRLEGIEGSIILNPTLPLNTVYITETLVTDSTIGTPVDPIIGDAFIKKIYDGNFSIPISGTAVSVPLPASGRSMLTFNNAALVSIAGFNLSEITGIIGAEAPHDQKKFIIFNNTGHALPLLDQNTTDPNNIPFVFRTAGNISIPNGEFIRLSYTSSGVMDLDKSWYSTNKSTATLAIQNITINRAATPVFFQQAINSATQLTLTTGISDRLLLNTISHSGKHYFIAPFNCTLKDIYMEININNWDVSIWKSDSISAPEANKTEIFSRQNINSIKDEGITSIPILKGNMITIFIKINTGTVGVNYGRIYLNLKES